MKNKGIWLIGFLSIAFLTIPFLFAYLLVLGKISVSQNLFLYLIIFVVSLLFALSFTKLLVKKVDEGTKNLLLLFFGACIVTYAVIILLITYSNYSRMVSQSIDVFYYHQVVWQLSEFKIPYLYKFNTPLFAAWSQHFEPILYLIAPVYWFIKSTTVLMILQAIIFLSGGVPIYLTVKKILGSRFIGMSLVFSYLAFEGTQFGIAYGFHPIMLFPAIFFWMYYFYTQKRIKLYFLFVILSLFVKEEVAFIMIFWGIYVFLFKKDRRIGLSTLTLGLLWYLLCFLIIFPKFNPGGFGYWGQYSQQGSTGVLGIVQFGASHPLDFLKTLISPSYKIDTIFQSLGSFGYLPLLFPPSLIILFPSLMEKLLSSGIAAINGTHYSAALTGATVVSVIESIHFFLKRKFLSRFSREVYLFLGLFIFYIALFFNLLYGYYAFSLFPTAIRTAFILNGTVVDPSDQNLIMLDQAMNAIPKEASISAQYQIVPHMKRDFKLLNDIPNENENADYVLVDVSLPPPILTKAEVLNKYLEDLTKNKKYKILGSRDGIVLYKRFDSAF